MFQRDANTKRHLYLVHRRTGTQGFNQGETKMNAHKLAPYSANAAVANGVTFLVSAWFLVAGAAILSDPTSVYTQRDAKAAPASEVAATQIAPEARLTIVVEAKRSSANL
jgi:hypothetical protein